MIGEQKEENDQLITLINDPIYHEDITAEELVEQLNNSTQERASAYFFNNLRLHLIDPAYLTYDPPQLQKDIQEIKKEAEKKYITDSRPIEEILLESARKMKENSQQENLFLAYVYIEMRKKGYPRYDSKKPCLVR